MRSLLIAALLLLPAAARAQVLPFVSNDANLNETLEWLANESRQNKIAINNISTGTATALKFQISSVTAAGVGLTATSYASGNMGVCVTGSTRTVTTSCQNVKTCYSGSASSASNSQFVIGALRGGAFFNGQTATSGGTYSFITAGTGMGAAFCLLQTGLTLGTYDWCLTAGSNGGVDVPGTHGAFGNAGARFWVEDGPCE